MGGWGVDLFFVLSGFLITGILLRARRQIEGSPSKRHVLRAFYARRFLRIFPLYYAVLLLLVVLGFSEVQKAFGWHALYQSNHHIMFLRGRWYGADVHFWSLAVEEQFYIMWPLLILWVPSRRLPLLMILAIVCGPLSCALLIPIYWGEEQVGTRVLMPQCLDVLSTGALLAWLWQQERFWMRCRRLIAGGRWLLVWRSVSAAHCSQKARWRASLAARATRCCLAGLSIGPRWASAV